MWACCGLTVKFCVVSLILRLVCGCLCLELLCWCLFCYGLFVCFFCVVINSVVAALCLACFALV